MFRKKNFVLCAVFFCGFLQAAEVDPEVHHDAKHHAQSGDEASRAVLKPVERQRTAFEQEWLGVRKETVRFLCFPAKSDCVKENYSVRYNIAQRRMSAVYRGLMCLMPLAEGLQNEFLKSFVLKDDCEHPEVYGDEFSLERIDWANYDHVEFRSLGLDQIFLKNLPAFMQEGAPDMFFDKSEMIRGAKIVWRAPSLPLLKSLVKSNERVFWIFVDEDEFETIRSQQDRRRTMFFIIFEGMGVLKGEVKRETHSTSKLSAGQSLFDYRCCYRDELVRKFSFA